MNSAHITDLKELSSIFDSMSEADALSVQKLIFEGVDSAFFNYVSPKAFVSTLNHWFTISLSSFERICREQHYIDNSISPSRQLENWSKLLGPVSKEEYVYFVSLPDKSDGALSARLARFFDNLAPDENATVDCFLRTLAFLSIQQFFQMEEVERNEYGEIRRRAESLIELITRFDVAGSSGEALLNANNIEDVLTCLRPYMQLDIDTEFIERTLLLIFEDGIAQTHKINPTENLIAEAENVKSDSEKEISYETPTDLTNIISGEAPSYDVTLTSSLRETDNTSSLKQYCVPDSLVNKSVLIPSFPDFRRKPEYALHLPLLNYSLAIKEKQQIVHILHSDLLNEEVADLALLLGLQMVTASSLERLATFNVSTGENPDFINTICLQKGIWKRHSLLLDKPFTAKQEHASWLNTHDDFLNLPLPICLIDALYKRIHALELEGESLMSGIPLYQLIALDADDLSVRLNHYLDKIKSQINYGFKQLSQKAIRYSLYAEIVHDNDASFASLLFACSEFSNPITLYYLSVPESTLQESYRSSLRNIGFDSLSENTSRDVCVGSKMCIDVDKLSERISTKFAYLKSRLEGAAQDPKTAIECHNDFAHLVTLAFAICSAAREQKEYFFDYGTIDEMHWFFFVSDKYHRGDNPTRLIPLTRYLTLLLRQYRLQLRATSYVLKDEYPELARLLYSLYQPLRSNPADISFMHTGQPMLGVIQNGQWKGLSSKSMSAFLGEDFSLPGNFTRHLMCSHVPKVLYQYRQQLMGYISQGHHQLDDMSLVNSWLESDKVSSELDKFLAQFGFMEIRAQSLKGAWSIDTLNYASMRYPKGFLERQSYDEQAFDYAKKYFITLLNENQTFEEFERAVSLLPMTLVDEVSKVSIAEKVKFFYARWLADYKRSKSKFMVKKALSKPLSACSTSLRLVEYNGAVEKLQRHFLNTIANNQQPLPTIDTFFISLALYQPKIAKQLLSQGKNATFSVKKYQGTMFLIADKKGTIAISAPLNWLSSYLIEHCDNRHTFNIDLDAAKKNLNVWLRCAYDQLYLAIPPIFSFEKLCNFVSDYGLFTQSRMSVSATADRVHPGDYPIEDIARLLTPAKGHFRDSGGNSGGHAKALIVPSYNNVRVPTGDIVIDEENENRFIELLLKALDDMPNTTRDISVENLIKRNWATYLNVNNTEFDYLVNASYKLSDFLRFWLFFAVVASRRPSNRYRGRRVSPKTVHYYLNTIDNHLRSKIKLKPYSMFGEEDFESLFQDVIKGCKKTSQEDVYDRLKDFHSKISEAFGISQPDWTRVKSQFDRKLRRKVGIAQLMPMADYEEALRSLKNQFLQNSNQEPHAQLEYDMHVTVMALGYRLGLRKSEIRSLLARHVNTELRVITVTSTRYYPTKSINSPRRIPVGLYLNEEEWGSLVRVIKHAEKIGSRLLSPALLVAGSLESRIMYINAIVSNCMLVCRQLTGNPKLRFYDFRHSHINYSVMILAGLIEDKRFEKSLARWARVKPQVLAEYRESLVSQLIGEQAEVGGILIYGLANQLGHSPITERQYYIHVLNIIDEFTVNRLINKQIADTDLFAILKTELTSTAGGFRPEHRVRQLIKETNFKELTKSKDDNAFVPLPIVRVLSRKYAFESMFMQLHACLKALWAVRDDASLQDVIVKHSNVPVPVWRVLHDYIEQTGYRSIYFPAMDNLRPLDFDRKRVKTALRFNNVEHFKSLFSTIALLYETSPKNLLDMLESYQANLFGDEVIIAKNGEGRWHSVLAVFDELTVDFIDSPSPFKNRSKSQSFSKLLVRAPDAKRKNSNDKLTFLVALTYATIQAF